MTLSTFSYIYHLSLLWIESSYIMQIFTLSYPILLKSSNKWESLCADSLELSAQKAWQRQRCLGNSFPFLPRYIAVPHFPVSLVLPHDLFLENIMWTEMVLHLVCKTSHIPIFMFFSYLPADWRGLWGRKGGHRYKMERTLGSWVILWRLPNWEPSH